MSRLLPLTFLLLVTSVTPVVDATEPAAPSIRRAPAVRVASLVNTISRRSVRRADAVPVFRDESDYVVSSGAAHGHGAVFSDQFGYQPGCCEDVGFTSGLWAGYCETRHSHWSHGSWFTRAFHNSSCCSSCQTAGAKFGKGKSRK